jgi:hypothetical protein
MQQTFFDVTPTELGQLGPEPAVAVLREMLWAEVHNIAFRFLMQTYRLR